MAAAEASCAARLRMMCSHGGLFLACGPDSAIRYVGGQTRVLVVLREVSFRELTAKLGEMAVGEIVSALRYRLADDDDVLVSVTCDEELAHMRDEYDRLKATRPSATFRVFFSGKRRAGSSRRPPLPPKMRRVQSEPALAAPPRARVHCGAVPAPPPMRRVQSAHDFAGRGRFPAVLLRLRHTPPLLLRLQPPPRPVPGAVAGAADASTTLHFQERARCGPRTCSRGSNMSKNSHGASAEGQEPAAVMSPARATTQMASSRDVQAAESNRAAFWEFE